MLPHQLDLRTGQLWAEGGSTLQLTETPHATAYLTTSVVMPPDSEVVAPVSVRSLSGIWPGPCSLMEPCMDLMEEYGVLVGHTLFDASSWSASVLMVNPNSDVIVLPSFSRVGNLVPVSAVSVRRHSGQAVQRQKRLYDKRAVRCLFAVGDWIMCYYPPAKKCNLDSVWVGPYLVVSLAGWAVGVQLQPTLLIV